MKPEISNAVAKITIAKIDEKQTRTGTAYPINSGMLLTARHVIEFPERDKTKPIQVEWPELNEVTEILPEDIKFAFDGGSECDVIILCCPIPTQIKLPTISRLLESQIADNRAGWNSAGYPKINQFKLKGVAGKFGVDLSKLEIDLTLDSPINELKLDFTDGWGGMSGAPVFGNDRQTIQAVITVHDHWMERELNGVSVPALLKIPAFRQAVGLDKTDEQHRYCIQLLHKRIEEQLFALKERPFFQTLAKKFSQFDDGLTPEKLWQAMQAKISADPESFLEQYRIVADAELNNDRHDLDKIRQLFLTLCGLFAEPAESAEALVALNVHQFNVRTPLAVEINLAVGYELAPDLVPEKKEGDNVGEPIKGRYAIAGECFPEGGWDAKANAEAIAKAANVAVKKMRDMVLDVKGGSDLDEFERHVLNKTIKTRRHPGNIRPELIRFEIASTDKLKLIHPLHNLDVLAVLRQKDWLPDLPIVQFGTTQYNEKEAFLSAQIYQFFRMIQKYEQS
jgi:hypothetical protein